MDKHSSLLQTFEHCSRQKFYNAGLWNIQMRKCFSLHRRRQLLRQSRHQLRRRSAASRDDGLPSRPTVRHAAIGLVVEHLLPRQRGRPLRHVGAVGAGPWYPSGKSGSATPSIMTFAITTIWLNASIFFLFEQKFIGEVVVILRVDPKVTKNSVKSQGKLFSRFWVSGTAVQSSGPLTSWPTKSLRYQ
jgi:hypothetical protein